VQLALITHRFVRGDGQGRVNYEVARAALDAGHVVWLVASEVAADLARHPRARVVRLPVSGWPTELLRNQVFALRSAWWLLRHRRQLDLVHVNGCITLGRADVNAAHFVHSAWLRSPHHTSRVRRDAYGLYQYLYTRLNAWLERRAYRRATRVVAVSEQVRRELRSIGVAGERLRVIANGVDIEEFRPAAPARGELGLPPGPLLLFVGDIKTPRKNLDTLLRALLEVPEAQLAVVGRTEGSPYPEMARTLGVDARVRFLGYRRDVARLMQAADVFVFPSRYEACSLVLLEAVASGLPVIAARTTGGTELLTSDCSVLIDDPGSAAQLAAAIRRIGASPVQLEAMRRAARALAEAHTWSAMAAAYLKLYAEIATQRSGTTLPTACATPR